MSIHQKTRWHFPAFLSRSRRTVSEKQASDQPRRWLIPHRRFFFWVSTALITIGAGVYVRAEIHRRVSRIGGISPINIAYSGGTLLIAGGGQLPEQIRQRFVDLAGGHDAKIVVIPAESINEQSRIQYRDSWSMYDVKSVDVLYAESRTQADDPDFSRVLKTATGVWLGGGKQAWLAAWYGRTRVESRLKELLARDGVIGGTSAGAAVMSRVMIASGRDQPTMGQGFDLIPGAVIDQHFIKRNRMNRLQTVLEHHPDLIGFGIDEGTALQYGVENGRFQVLGQSSVVACVMRKSAENEKHPKLHLQFLNPGDESNVEQLRRGDPIPPRFTDFESILLGE
ncbi:MAG: cyanophycinase [Schlesneria sp.]